ncbi:anaphase-promoting complex subunit [Diplodia corticola]|uniref:Anaphase-promoting complex subunit 2 n=1 Tax=Diplodia corticola TaxID=236234 RepID=A0A1J9SEB6_9PEZI|nr:anaphase-promoting complex subunit [Diplodia corticola]OJD37925.1 anaphase-promoting complex subunit [Diplodia corticola]
MAAALQNQRNLIFASVFPFAAQSHGSYHSSSAHPTPLSAAAASPDTTFAAPSHHHNHHHSSRSTHHHHDRTAAHNPKLVQRNVAWNTATRFLKLPEWHPPPSTASDDNNNNSHTTSSTTSTSTPSTAAPPRPRKHHHRLNADVEEALRYLLIGDGRLDAAEYDITPTSGSGSNLFPDLLEWYTNEAREHFVACVRPALLAAWRQPVALAGGGAPWRVLERSAATLQAAQAFYSSHLDECVLPVVRELDYHQQHQHQHYHHRGGGSGGDEVVVAAPLSRAEKVARKFRRDLHAIVMHALPQQRFAKTLAWVLFDAGCGLFGLEGEGGGWGGGGGEEEEESRVVRERVAGLLRELRDVGLGGDQAQRAAAQAMDSLMDAFIGSHHMKVDWYGKKPMTRVLREWVKDGYSPFIREILSCLTGDEEMFEVNEVQQWTNMAIGRLGRARVENLFDYIVNWDRSLGAILDLKEYITSPAARNHLTNSFLQQVSRRLLHAGATTTHILDIYIYVIRAFIELDPKGILLEKVARPIRRYLRDREDTARIIVSSLLADVEDEYGNRVELSSDISAEIAEEMLNPVAANVQDEDLELNWTDMNWMPDPVDASPEYRKAKSENVLAYLLSLYDREDFINELKNILGEHLLKNEGSDFEKEIRLLELFKLRLGDSNLQACEVMLKDVLESKRMNKQIHHILKQQSDVYRDTPTELNSQILSSFFWPSLREDDFHLPEPIQQLMKEYEAGFEGIKDMRKLHWLPALGRVAVSLDFDDRSLELEVLPWQAAVIYAFQEEDDTADGASDDEPPMTEEEERQHQRRARLRAVGASDVAPTPEKPKKKKPPVTKTVEQLEAALEMDESLVRSALTFWVGHRALLEQGGGQPDAFAVIDSLAELDSAADKAARLAAAEARERAEEQDAVGAGAAVKSADDVLVENMQMYRQFVVGMLTANGRMGADRVCGMLKMALMGGFPFGVEEVGVLLGRMVEEGVLVQAGDGFAVKK